MKRVILSGSFDNLRSHHVRLLEESAKLGEVHVLLWSDETVRHVEGRWPRFLEAERKYLVEAIRYAQEVTVIGGKLDPDLLPDVGRLRPDLWVVDEQADTAAKRAFCSSHGLGYRILTGKQLAGFPIPQPDATLAGRKKVIVTGCFDWFHSGHVRFFEEVSQLGDLYVVVGHDENIRLLKGDGHPLLPVEERRYMVASVRYVEQALISTGHGWMDAEPEIHRLKPDSYAVNEDGDRPEKREFCRQHSLQYVVLKRTPKEGLPQRSSTDLRQL